MAVGADNSTVKITIDVVDANSGTVVAKTTKNLSSMGAAGSDAGKKIGEGGKEAAQWLSLAGYSGEEAGKKISKGMGEAGAHTLTNLDKVRLLRDDLGIRIPRAMENVIARSQAASAAIGAIGSGLVALGGAEIFIRMALGAYELYKRLTDVNSAMKKYTEQAQTAATQKLFDTASIESVNAMSSQLRNRIESLDQKQQRAGVGDDGSGSMVQYLGYGYLSNFQAYTSTDDKKKAEAQANLDVLRDRKTLLEQQAQIETTQAQGAARMAALTGDAAKRVKQETADAVAGLVLQQTQENELLKFHESLAARDEARRQGKKESEIPDIYVPSKDAGQSAYGDTVRNNHEALAADRVAEARKESEETLHIQAEARAAGLQGEALYIAQRNEHLRQLAEKMRDTELTPLEYMKRVAAAEQQYAAERQKRLDSEHAETARMRAEAAAGGQRGMAAIDARTSAEILGVEKAAPGFSDLTTKAQREAAIRAKANAEALEEQQQFTLRLDQMSEGHANSSMSANARIAAETKRTIAEIEKAWSDEYGQLNAMDQRRVQSRAAVNEAIAKIEADAAKQRQEVRQSIADETDKMEAEAARRGLTREQEARAAIIDEYNQRYQHLEELRAKDADNADLYRRQEIAAEEIKNGKLIEQNRAMRDKLAGTIRGFISNPVDAAKRLGEEAASKTAADLLMKVTGRQTGDAGSLSSKGGFGGALQGAMAGAELGSYAGPLGTAIGAGAGAIIGFIGIGGKNKAEDYYNKSVKPRINADVMQFGMGSMDYQSASDDLIKLNQEARQQTKQFGQGGKSVWNDLIKPQIDSAIANLDREQKAGRSKYGVAAAQFHNGGLISDFGAMSTTGNQGWVHAQQGEYVMRQQVVPSHYQGLQLIQSGASHSDMAAYYGANNGSNILRPTASAADVNLHFHSPDAAGALSLFMENKHHLRTALNASYSENSGDWD